MSFKIGDLVKLKENCADGRPAEDIYIVTKVIEYRSGESYEQIRTKNLRTGKHYLGAFSFRFELVKKSNKDNY